MSRALVVMSLVLGLLAVPAAAEPAQGCRLLAEGAHEEVCRVETWFHPAGAAVGNLAWVTPFDYPSWSTDEPTTSSEDGGGATSIAQNTLRFSDSDGEEPTGATFVGSFEGAFDAIAFRLHVTEPHRHVCPPFSCYPNSNVWLRVKADDVTLFQSEVYQAVPVADRESDRHRLDFAVTGLHAHMVAAGLSTGPDTRHDLRIELSAGAPTIYEYGATDAASGMVFNPTPDELETLTLLTRG